MKALPQFQNRIRFAHPLLKRVASGIRRIFLSTLRPLITRGIKAGLEQTGLEVRRIRLSSDRQRNYANFAEQAVLETLLKAHPKCPKIFVDIGAGDGITHSNTFALAEAGWGGALIEAEPVRFARLATFHRHREGVVCTRAFATPPTIAALIEGLGIPFDFGFLSLDIDGYDREVLERLLEKFRPRIICAEINEKIPPPLRFSVSYRSDYRWREDHFYGQSLCALHDLVQPLGYRLESLEYNNAFYSLGTDGLSPEQAYAEGYRNRPDRLQRLPWNRDMEALQTLDPEAALKFVSEKFSAYSGRFTLSL
jgi:hypothetical protein